MNLGGLLGGVIVGSLRHRFAVLSLAALLTAFGLFSLRDVNYDVFPDFAPPQASIQVEAPGFSPEQVEMLVTRPVESAIAGVPGVVTIRSNSIQGLAVVTIVFDVASDVFRVRQQLTEAMTGLAKQLPDGVEDPKLTPLTSSTGTVMIAGVTSDVLSPMRLRTVADWTIRPRLLAVPGVAKLTIFGGETKQYQIGVDPARLARFGLSLNDVREAARQALGVRGTGFIDSPNQRIVIAASDDAAAVSRLKDAVVAQRGPRRLTLGEVASVSVAPEPPIGASLINGRPGIQIIVSAQYGANTVKVAAAVDRVIAGLNRELAPDGVTIRSDIFRPVRFIRTALGSLGEALIVGGLLVTVVVLLFLWNMRMAVIALTAIPLSLLAGTVAMNALGYSLSTMTLGGLAIAVGVLVDDAVIVVENVYRRMRLHRAAADATSAQNLIAAATYEVRSAVVFATLAIALMFVPVFAIQDVAGRLFGPLGLAYVLATLASLAVALTVTPALCSVLIDFEHLPTGDAPLVRGLRHRYRIVLNWVDRHLSVVAAAVVGVSLAVFAFVPELGTSFIPELKEGHYVALMTLAPGSSLEASTRIGARVADALLKLPHVRLVSQLAGRADKSDDVFGTHYSEFEIDLAPTDAEGQEQAEAGIRDALRHFPGATFAVRTFLSDRLDEVISGYTAPVIVRAAGTNLDALDSTAAQIAGALSTVRGAVDVQLQNPSGVPELSIVLDDQALARWGFDALTVLDDIGAAYRGAEVGKVYEGNRVFDAAIFLDAKLRKRPELVSTLMLKAPDGTFVPLSALASIRTVSGRYGVLHEGGRRVQIVTANTEDEDLGAFAARVKAKIAGLRLPPGVTVELTGTAVAQSRSMTALLINSCLAIGAMALLLSFNVGRLRNLALVFLNLPFAMVGGIIAVLASGGVASLGAMVGFVTLFGITLRNAIMMIAHYEHLTRAEDRPWTIATAIEGATDRLSPILMTSLATALGLLPLALGSSEPGRELEGPMAIVILGGLISSSALNLFILPALAHRWGRFEPTLPPADNGLGAPVSIGTDR